MSKVIVFGATGYAGSNITRELLARGHRVTAVARDTTKLDELADQVTVASGDLHDQSFLTQVTQGADVVVVALPARALVEGGPRLVDAVPALTEAVAAAGARLGVVGGAGSLQVSEGGPRLVDTEGFPAEFRGEALDHSAVLDALQAQDRADWFYLSPAASFGGYNPGTRTGAYRTGTDVLLTTDEGASEISGADYAIAFVDEVETPRHRNTRFSVAY